KENVIIGKIIPAGTGMFRYRNIEPLADLSDAPEVVASVEVEEVK
ncbi:MAG TPA: DNA-directed RNA polymerase subunit beta', partial [Lactococcus sp.]|nr:DNA-directed RNA polymerase subunit beta' [Lactococcus sp.]